MKQKIIDYIASYRVSCADVSDAIGLRTPEYSLRPLVSSPTEQYDETHAVGECFLACAVDDSNWMMHRDLQQLDNGNGKILFVKAQQCNQYGILGALTAEYVFRRGTRAIVVDGYVRDSKGLRQRPIWCRGRNPCGSNHNVTGIYHDDWIEQMKSKYDGSVVVCDDDGVITIHKDKLTAETYDGICAVREREREWFNKLDAGMTTFKIVCGG